MICFSQRCHTIDCKVKLYVGKLVSDLLLSHSVRQGGADIQLAPKSLQPLRWQKLEVASHRSSSDQRYKMCRHDYTAGCASGDPLPTAEWNVRGARTRKKWNQDQVR